MTSIGYSPLCDQNPSLYLAYLFACASNGERVVVDSAKCGRRHVGQDCDCSFNVGRGVALAYRDFCRSSAVENAGLDEVNSVVDNDVIAGSGYDASVFDGARQVINTSDSRVVDNDRRVVGSVVHGSGETTEKIGLVNDNASVNHSGGCGYGPNYQRNRMNREQKKRRKARKRALVSENWRASQPIREKEKTVVPVVDGVHSPVTDSGSKGFWNSCSDGIRQQLIDSKARMHIADNLKRAEEAERRVQRLQSPEQLLRDAMRMVKFAEEQAKDKNDSKVRGWAKTVAESYAESIARSASTSVESFDKYLEGKSSITSVSLEVFEDVVKEKDQLVESNKKLQDEIDRLKGKKELQKYVVSTEVQTMQRYAAAAKKSEKKPVCSQEHFLKVQAEKTKGVQDPYAFPWNYDREIVEYEPAKY